jgi:hypothetical protein
MLWQILMFLLFLVFFGAFNRKIEDWSLIRHLKNHPVDGDLFLSAPSQNWAALSSPGLFKTWGWLGQRGSMAQWLNGKLFPFQ